MNLMELWESIMISLFIIVVICYLLYSLYILITSHTFSFSKKEYDKILNLFTKHNIIQTYETHNTNNKVIEIEGLIEYNNLVINILVTKEYFKTKILLDFDDIDFYIRHNIYTPLKLKFNSIDEFHETFKTIGVGEYFEMQFRQKIKELKKNSIKSIANSFEV